MRFLFLMVSRVLTYGLLGSVIGVTGIPLHCSISFGLGTEKKVSTLATLDFSKVHFVVRTIPEYEQRLTTRALARFRKVGLNPITSADLADRSAEVVATLVLTLKPMSAEVGCGKVMIYDNGLELREDAVTIRNPNLTVEAVTWFIQPGVPGVLDEVSLERMEKDLDWYIDRFIVAYGLGRPTQ